MGNFGGVCFNVYSTVRGLASVLYYQEILVYVVTQGMVSDTDNLVKYHHFNEEVNK